MSRTSLAPTAISTTIGGLNKRWYGQINGKWRSDWDNGRYGRVLLFHALIFVFSLRFPNNSFFCIALDFLHHSFLSSLTLASVCFSLLVSSPPCLCSGSSAVILHSTYLPRRRPPTLLFNKESSAPCSCTASHNPLLSFLILPCAVSISTPQLLYEISLGFDHFSHELVLLLH